MSLLALKSEEQIFGDAFARITSTLGLNDVNPGSVLSVLLQAMAAEDFQQYMMMIDIIRNFNLDTTTGTDLDNKAFEFGLTRNKPAKATGLINILRSSNFTKLSTTLYSGKPVPTKGDTSLYVNDASATAWGTSGTLIIGRGTANQENVTYSIAPVNNTNYWTFTVSPLSNNHGLNETVILSQGGNVTISAGTLVVVPATGVSVEIDFTLDQDTLLLDGEVEVDSVSVTAATAGSQGNIPVQAIAGTTSFPTPPTAGARATNPAAFTTGQDLESDDQLRGRIKNVIQSLSRGVKTAILNGTIGLVDPVTAKRVVSASVILPTNSSQNTKIFIDDGTGFEPSFSSQGFETILASANGGETRLQLQQFPLVKAQVETDVAQPYNMSSGSLTLSYAVGGQSETVTFFTTDFAFSNAASAQEIATAINSRATLVQARTAAGAQYVVLTAISDTNETIQVTGGTANAFLNFPTTAVATLYLYVNDKLLSKDGSTATAISGAGTFNFSGLGGSSWPLTVIVDGKSANTQTVTFVTGDFAVPSAGTATEVAAAINARLAGATASLVPGSATKLQISSNTTLSASGSIQITGGSANGVLGFSTSLISGANSDYTLNRFLGQIQLNSALTPNSSVTASSLFTRAFLRCASPESYIITAGQTLIVTIDGGSPKTVTFANTGTYTAAQLVTQINAQLVGASASVRSIGGLNYLELSTSTYDQGTGSLSISGTSTATGLNFVTGTTVTNARPQAAYQVSGNSGPYIFALGQSLIGILDNSPSTETFSVLMNYAGTVTTGTSTTVFLAAAFSAIFPTDSSLNSFWVVFTSGANTNSNAGTVTTITNPSGSTFQYAFSALPTNLANYSAGDHVTFSGMQNAVNNGSFIITSVSTAGNGYIRVTNVSGVVEAGSTGSVLTAARRQISGYSHGTGSITLSSALPSVPGITDTFAILPSTVANTVLFMNNNYVTPLSSYAYIEAVYNGTKVQITSQQVGSNGWVQVTGGFANSVFGFSTTQVNGLQGYQYYTGLLALVNKTIYGDDTDPVSYPGIGASGVQFDIEAPTVQEVLFSLKLTLAQGFSLNGLSDQIRTAVTQYVDGLGVGKSVILSEVVGAIVAVNGVADVTIVSPTANVLIAQNQLPRSKSSDVTLG